MYITAAQLLNIMGGKNLAKIAQYRVGETINVEALAAVCDDEDISGYLDDVVANAVAAKAVIDAAIDSASNDINGYLARVRTLPLDQGVIDQSPLQNIAYALVRYRMMQRPDDATQRDQTTAMSQLRDIAKGNIVLGGEDPQPIKKASMVTAKSTSRFPWDKFGR